jgi:hypothetical protein
MLAAETIEDFSFALTLASIPNNATELIALLRRPGAKTDFTAESSEEHVSVTEARGTLTHANDAVTEPTFDITPLTLSLPVAEMVSSALSKTDIDLGLVMACGSVYRSSTSELSIALS